MIVKEKLGNIKDEAIHNRIIEHMTLEWHETNKRILHKHSNTGKVITIRFLKENQNLTQGDIIYRDDEIIVVIDILPCEVIIIRPVDIYEMASVCYEIGNKHLPLFFQDDELLVPFEEPLFRFLSAAGYEIKKGEKKLINPLKSTVTPHGNNNTSLFSRILKLTTPPDE